MNLLEIRTQLVELTGRYDFVADYEGEDFTDAGADFFIKAGNRLLDSRVDLDKSYMRYQKDILAGDFFLTFPRCRAIHKVYASNADGRIDLTEKSITWIRNEYNNMALKAVGDAVFSANPSAGEAITIDSDTYTFDTDIDIGTSVTSTIDNAVTAINAGTSTVEAARLGTHTLRIRAVDEGYDGNSIVFTTTAANISVNGSGTLGGTIAGCDGESLDSGNPLYYTPIIIGLSGSQSTLTHNTFGKDFTFDAEGIMFGSHYNYDGIMVMPPADETFTITVLANFFSKELSSDSDENYWSVVYPDLLIQAAMYKIEVFYRNTEGARDILGGLDIALFGIEKDVVMQEIANTSSMRRPDFNYEDFNE